MNLKSLIGKLNDSTRGALEAAAGLCLARTHYDIEVEHYLTKLLDSTDNDAAAIFNTLRSILQGSPANWRGPSTS
jgi:type VI secretion system protein VasG